MSEDRTLPHPTGGPVLLNEPGVKVVARCSIDGEVVDLNEPDHHVCIPVKDGAPRKVTVSVARQEYEDAVAEKVETELAERTAAAAAAKRSAAEDAAPKDKGT